MHVHISKESADAARVPRRRPAHCQRDIARALRAAKQVDSEFGIRLEPDGAIVIGRFPTHGTPPAPSALPVRDFVL